MVGSVFVFLGDKLIAEGLLPEVEDRIKNLVDRQNILVFDRDSGKQINVELTEEVIRSSPLSGGGQDDVAAGQSKRGRPKLGVVGREVTLLPRHWEWLDSQRGGASAILRRLVDQYRAANAGQDKVRMAQDSTNRFLYAIAGNLNDFEEAVRALYSNNAEKFADCIKSWPADIRRCARHYSDSVWQ